MYILLNFWAMLGGLRLKKDFEFRAIQLHIDSKVLVQNILDFGQGSIIRMRLTQQIRQLLKLDRGCMFVIFTVS